MPIRIFIDQGHNPMGVNAGAEGFGLREQDINYAVGMELAKLLNSDPRFTARVSRTTPTDTLGTSNSTSLQRRVYLANSWPADYFISIHCNASTSTCCSRTVRTIAAASAKPLRVFNVMMRAYRSSVTMLDCATADRAAADSDARGYRNPTCHTS